MNSNNLVWFDCFFAETETGEKWYQRNMLIDTNIIKFASRQDASINIDGADHTVYDVITDQWDGHGKRFSFKITDESFERWLQSVGLRPTVSDDELPF